MRRCLALLAVAAFALLLSCSKKSSAPPTAPAPDPACSLSSPALSFGILTVGSSLDRTFILTNTGGGTLSGTVTETHPEFSVVGSATYSLTAGKADTLIVRFAPTTVGAKACTLQTGSASCPRVVCTGTALAPAPQCQAAPSSLNFGSFEPFCSRTRLLTVTNVGTGTLSGSVSSPCPEFVVEGDPSYSLGAGQFKEFTIRFTPTSLGIKSCELSLGNGLCSGVQATGTASIFLDTRGCSFSPISSALDFGDVCVGTTVTRQVALQVSGGPGGGEIPISGGVSCPDFGTPDRLAWVAWADPDRLPSGGGATLVNITFAPTREGNLGALVVIHCGDTGPGGSLYPRAYVLCAGRGVVAGCQAGPGRTGR